MNEDQFDRHDADVFGAGRRRILREGVRVPSSAGTIRAALVRMVVLVAGTTFIDLGLTGIEKDQ